MCVKKQFKYCQSHIDECMKIIIQNLNFFGIKTLACCCGHGKYPMTIVIGPAPIEIFSDKVIPREKKFYKKDEQGYYFIPECTKTEEFVECMK